jgi:methionine-gamma-lyase
MATNIAEGWSFMNDSEKRAFATRTVHHPQARVPLEPVSTPIYQTSTYRADAPGVLAELACAVQPSTFYSRYGNPTVEVWERAIADLEGGEHGLAFASGMAAVSTVLLGLLETGNHIVAGSSLYTATTMLLRSELPKVGVAVDFVDPTRPEAFAAALRPETRVFYIESPSNPLMLLTDIAAVCRIARGHGVWTVVDNTFATPYNQRPLALGADVVIHSATKYLGGHSDVLGGCAVTNADLGARLWHKRTLLGGCLDPFAAWLLLRGAKTLALRVERQNANAMALAKALERHPAVARVHYPGLGSHPQHELTQRQMAGAGGMLSFELVGGRTAGERLVSSTRIALLAVSLGGVETLIEHPASMSHALLSDEELMHAGISPGLVRMSVGIEDAGDLIADLEHALRCL